MKILGPISCINCGKSVWWDRIGAQLRLMEGESRHVCAKKRGETPSAQPNKPSTIAA